MTVIAWDGKSLVADKRASCNGYPATTTKIVRAKGGELMGACGDTDMGLALKAWFDRGAIASTYPDNRRGDGGIKATLMIISKDGAVHLYCSEPYPIVLENKFHAIGSGSDFALAAMHLGYDARKAAEVACALDNDCGNGLDILELE